MRISRTMLRAYVDQVAIPFFAATPDVPEDPDAYDDDIDDMLVDARDAGDIDYLRLGLLAAVYDDGEDIDGYGDAEVPLRGGELEQLLLQIVEKIEPIDPFDPEGPGVPVTLEEMSSEEWAAIRG